MGANDLQGVNVAELIDGLLREFLEPPRAMRCSEWADDVRKLREVDKATPEQIRFMITWVQGGDHVVPNKPVRKFEAHEFWAKNILSGGKLRKQWFNLVPQLQQSLKKTIEKTAVAQL